MTTYSPEPWSYTKVKFEDGFSVTDANGESVTETGCGCCAPKGVGVWDEEDARLIAAAPDLRDALESLTRALMSKSAMMDKTDWLAIEKANAAISKARGES